MPRKMECLLDLVACCLVASRGACPHGTRGAMGVVITRQFVLCGKQVCHAASATDATHPPSLKTGIKQPHHQHQASTNALFVPLPLPTALL